MGKKAKAGKVTGPVRVVEEGLMPARVYPTDDGSFVVADQAGWVPGSFTTVDAAVEGARRANDIAVPSSVPLLGTKRVTEFEGGFSSRLRVEVYAADERETYARDRVRIQVSDERSDAASDLAADEVNELQAVLRRWLAARGIAEVAV